MKSKINIFRFVFSVITKPVSFCKNLYFWYKTDKRRKKEHLEFIKIRKSNQNKWLKVSQNIENKLNTKGYFEECDFRDMLGLNCENTITSKICDERVIEIYNRFTNQLVDTCNFSIQAEELTGVNSKNIQQNLRGANKRAGDFIFKYKIL